MILRIYTDADLTMLRLWLTEAYEARRVVAMGGKITSASYDGKSVTYSSANSDALGMWIRDLVDTIAFLEGRRTGRRPILGTF